MQDDNADIRRREDGSIDFDYYNRKGSLLRMQAIKNMSYQVFRQVSGALWPLAGGAVKKSSMRTR